MHPHKSEEGGEVMRHYEFKLSFQTYRDLTADELANL